MGYLISINSVHVPVKKMEFKDKNNASRWSDAHQVVSQLRV